MANVLLRYWYFSTLMERRYATVPAALRAARSLVDGANGVPAEILCQGESLYDQAWLDEFTSLSESLASEVPLAVPSGHLPEDGDDASAKGEYLRS